MVTDYDAWHPGESVVGVDTVLSVLADNSHRATRLLARLARDFPSEHETCPVGSDRALDEAIMTHSEARDPKILAKLDAVAGRVLGAGA
jgi:5'-methylthioadenosine phosphorylase